MQLQAGCTTFQSRFGHDW